MLPFSDSGEACNDWPRLDIPKPSITPVSSLAVMQLSVASTIARSITFLNSRMLPSQSYAFDCRRQTGHASDHNEWRRGLLPAVFLQQFHFEIAGHV